MSVKHFLHISDYSKEELWEILDLAKIVKSKFRKREDNKVFNNKSLAMIFAKPSARTRVSFETGFEWMGGHALFLGPNDIGIGKREAIKDISRSKTLSGKILAGLVLCLNSFLPAKMKKLIWSKSYLYSKP